MRRVLLAVLGVVVLLAAAGTGWWFWLAARTECIVREWIDERRMAGDLAEHGEIRTDGFPTRIRLHVADPKLGRAGDGWTWQWTGPMLLLEAPSWAPDQLSFFAPGKQLVTGEVGEAARPLRLELSGVVGTLRPEEGRWTLRAHGYDLRLTERDRPQRAATAAALDLLLGFPHTAPRQRVAVDLDTLVLPEPGLLGDTLAHIGFDAEATVPLPADQSAAALARWRDAGGTVDVARLAVSYGALVLQAKGDLALDPELRPAGRVDGRMQGWDALIDALARRGDVPERTAAPAKLVLGLLARPAPEGGPPAIEAPIVLADGQIRLGPLVLGTLDPLAR